MTHLNSTSPALPAQELAADWELLFNAVLAKLRHLAGDPPPLPLWPPPGDALARVQAGVLECAVALEQIRALISDQIALLHRPAARGAEG